MLNLRNRVAALSAAVVIGTAGMLAVPAAADGLNELGLNEEQAIAYNAAIEEARSYADRRRFREALNAYHTALKIYDQDYSTYFNMGVSYQGLGRDDSAAVMLNRAIELNPDFARARLALATAYLKQGDLDNAVQAYNCIVNDMPDSINYVMAAEQGLFNVAIQYTNEAVREIQNRDLDAAEQNANRAVELAPNTHRPDFIAAMVQERKRDYESAERFYESALASATTDEERAAALNGMGRLAIDNARAAVRDGNDAAARNARLKAVEYLQQAVELDPNRASGWVNLGNTLYDLERFAEARNVLLQARQLDQRDHRIPFKLAETYMQLGDCEAAERAASDAIRLQRSDASSRAVRAEALECLGRKREAIDEYEAAARDPRWRQRATFQAKKLREELGL